MFYRRISQGCFRGILRGFKAFQIISGDYEGFWEFQWIREWFLLRLRDASKRVLRALKRFQDISGGSRRL